MGPNLLWHLGGGEGGIQHFMETLMPLNTVPLAPPRRRGYTLADRLVLDTRHPGGSTERISFWGTLDACSSG